jgi:glutamyl-tRNA reductase
MMVQSKKDKVPLVVLGCDFRTASTMWREKLILSEAERRELFETLGRLDRDTGIVSLITCNRSEWIVSARDPRWVADLLFSHVMYLWDGLKRSSGHAPSPYVYMGRDAARHVLRVVAGLESFVMGEQQIAHQFHMAVKEAREEKTSTGILNGLEKIAGALTKKLRDRALARTQSVGIHSIVVRFVERNFAPAAGGGKGSVAVAGMGRIGRKAAALLEESGRWNVIRVNRTLRSPAWVPLSQLERLAGEVDGIVLCTGSEKPVSRLSDLGRRRRRKPLWIVDIGVPSQLEVDAVGPGAARVVGLDRLVREPSDTMMARWIEQVEQEVESGVSSFEIFCRERSMVDFLQASQTLHKDYIRSVIPSFVEEHFSHLGPSDRKQLKRRLRKLLIDYSNTLLDKFHSSF